MFRGHASFPGQHHDFANIKHINLLNSKTLSSCSRYFGWVVRVICNQRHSKTMFHLVLAHLYNDMWDYEN